MPDTNTEYRLAQILQIDIKLAERVLEVVQDMEQDIFPDHEALMEECIEDREDAKINAMALENEVNDLKDCLRGIKRQIENLL